MLSDVSQVGMPRYKRTWCVSSRSRLCAKRAQDGRLRSSGAIRERRDLHLTVVPVVVTRCLRHAVALSFLTHRWFDLFPPFGTARAPLFEVIEMVRAYAWNFKGEEPAMRFWSVTLLIATLFLLLYGATYFSLSHTRQQTSQTSTEPSPEKGESADTPRGVILDVGTAELDFFLTHEEGPVVVDFWAAWCGPCKILDPILETLAKEFANRATFLRVDFDEHYELARRYDITAVPTVVVLVDGREVERFEGVTSAEVLRESLRRAGANERLTEVAPHHRTVATASGE